MPTYSPHLCGSFGVIALSFFPPLSMRSNRHYSVCLIFFCFEGTEHVGDGSCNVGATPAFLGFRFGMAIRFRQVKCAPTAYSGKALLPKKKRTFVFLQFRPLALIPLRKNIL